MTIKLLKHTHEDIDLFYTSSMISDMELHNEIKKGVACWSIVKHFIEDIPNYNAIVNAYAKKNNLERVAILAAHGEEIKSNWHYFNGTSSYSIQSWINKMDGKYKALILNVCNPEKNSIQSKKSIVLHPNDFISNRLLMQEAVPIELFLPGTGYVDSYIIEEELNKLKD